MNIGIKSLFTGVLLLLAGAGALWYLLGGAGEQENPWLSGAEGYEQAQRLALREGYPLLYVIERAKCRRCKALNTRLWRCLLYTSPSPRDRTRSRMPSSA